MNLLVTADIWTMNGAFYNHVDPWNPNSALGSQITTMTHTGSLSDPNPTPGLDRALTNPGEVGLIAQTGQGFSDGVDTVHGGTAANPLVDNVGVSITNFTVPTPVPEPSTVLLLGTVVGLAAFAARRRNAKQPRG
jgi:hypothetical protein